MIRSFLLIWALCGTWVVVAPPPGNQHSTSLVQAQHQNQTAIENESAFTAKAADEFQCIALPVTMQVPLTRASVIDSPPRVQILGVPWPSGMRQRPPPSNSLV